MKKKYDKVITKRSMYRAYCKAYDWLLNESQWNEYIKVITDTIKQWIIEEGGYYILPHDLGQMYIRRNKPSYFYKDENGNRHIRNSMINRGETIKLRQKYEPDKPFDYWLKLENRDKHVVVFTNEHTEGYAYKINYTYDYMSEITRRARMSFFYIRPNFVFRKKLGRFLKNNKKIPTYYDNNKRIINFRKVEEKITANNKHRQRWGFRKYLDSLEINRNKTD